MTLCLTPENATTNTRIPKSKRSDWRKHNTRQPNQPTIEERPNAGTRRNGRGGLNH